MKWTNASIHHVVNGTARRFSGKHDGSEPLSVSAPVQRPVPMTHRSGLKMAGAFLLITAVAGVGGVASQAGGHADNTSDSTASAAHRVASASSANSDKTNIPQAAPATDNSSTGNATTSSTSTSVSTSTDSNGTNEVMVNGQPVAVPDNGTVRHVTSDDAGRQTSVEISHHHDTAGNATNDLSTSVTVSTSDDSTSRKGDTSP